MLLLDAFALHGEFQNKRNGMKGKLQAKRVWENLDSELTSKKSFQIFMQNY